MRIGQIKILRQVVSTKEGKTYRNPMERKGNDRQV